MIKKTIWYLILHAKNYKYAYITLNKYINILREHLHVKLIQLSTPREATYQNEALNAQW